jgi:uncharacterized iron-regulated membrane protein
MSSQLFVALAGLPWHAVLGQQLTMAKTEKQTTRKKVYVSYLT